MGYNPKIDIIILFITCLTYVKEETTFVIDDICFNISQVKGRIALVKNDGSSPVFLFSFKKNNLSYYRVENNGDGPEIKSFYEYDIDPANLALDILKYRTIDDAPESLILAFGRDPFHVEDIFNEINSILNFKIEGFIEKHKGFFMKKIDEWNQ